MCRSDVAPNAQPALADLLDRLATALADEAGVPRSTVLIGPVDFGPEERPQ
jgi:hypothetical protein